MKQATPPSTGSALEALAAPAEYVKAACSSYSDLQSSDGQKYTVYNITVTDSTDHTHSLQKRFNEFNELYRSIKNQYPEVAAFSFPSKTFTFSKDQAVIKETRREKFNEFIAVREGW